MILCQYTRPDGTIEYGARGALGEDYQALYEWLYTVSYKCVFVDFPWDYFIFTNSEDEQEFRRRYGEKIYVRKD